MKLAQEPFLVKFRILRCRFDRKKKDLLNNSTKHVPLVIGKYFFEKLIKLSTN